MTTIKASPSLITTASFLAGSTTVVGSAIPEDSAVLSGGYNETGTITFTLTAPDNTVVDTEMVTPNGDGTYTTSNANVATQVGTYVWTVSYAGDGLNNGTVDQGGAAEKVTTIKASPAINTVAGGTVVIGSGTKLTDTAVLSGGYNPTGTITFTLYSPSNVAVYTDVVTVSGDGTYTTATGTNPGGYLPTVTGTYLWSAIYSGDSNNSGATTTVRTKTKRSVQGRPGDQHGGRRDGGDWQRHEAHRHGGALGRLQPTGTITFTLYSPSNVAIYTDVVTVSGNGTYTTATGTNPGGYLPTVTGTYLWSAVYSGDSNNSGAHDNGQNENETVTKASPTLVTTASLKAGCTYMVTSAIPEDSAVLSGGYNETGTLTFKLYAPNNTVIDTETITTHGNGTYTTANTVAATQVGTYTWKVSFAGDGLNNSAVDQGGAAEQITTTKSGPTLVTTAKATASGVVGTALLSDSVVVSGGVNPGGTLTFTLTAPDHTTTTQTKAFSGDGTYTNPTAVLATQVGTYTWTVSYAGDSLNNGAVDQGGTAEQSTTVKASPTLVTTASLKAGCTYMVTSAIPEDSAVLSGGYNETGTLTFKLYAPNNTVIDTETITTHGNGTYTTANTVAATQVGTYTWKVSFAGDGLNNSAVDQGGAAEQITTTKSGPTLVTTAKATASGVVGTALLSDSVVVSGGVNPGGTLTFTLTAPDHTTTTQTKAFSGDGTYTNPTAVLATQVGTYTWTVSYAGDSLNNGAVDQGGTAEQVTTCKASPTAITTASFKTSSNVVGSAIPEDSVVLSGGFKESGQLTFRLYAPDNSVVDTETVTPSGNGTYTTTNTNVATQIGTYTWKVTFAGDSLNNGTVDRGGAAEQLTVVCAPITISGTKFSDLTGNGFSADDTGLGGVTIGLYKESNGTAGLQTGTGGDTLVSTTTTSSNGTYGFGNLVVPATYYVQESVPTGYVQTGGGPCGTAGSTYYTISAQSGQTYTNNNFDDFSTADCVNAATEFTNISYVINGSTTVTDLHGNTHQGDLVKVNFTVAAGIPPHQLTLVSYTAPGPTFDVNVASQQRVYDYDTGFFGPGTYSLEVRIPNSYFQIDFVCGPLINPFGAAGSNVFYTQQGRLFSADNGGTTAVLSNGASLTGTVFVDGNKNGVHDAGEVGIGAVKVTLTGTDSQGAAVNVVEYTKSDGTYLFGNLKAGKYTISETSPAGFTDGLDIVGSLGGTLGSDVLSNINVAASANGINYDFSEKLTTLGSGYSASITPVDSANATLLINGTPGIDVITVNYASYKYNVFLNGTSIGSFANKDSSNRPVTRLVVNGGAGNDDISIDSSVTITSELYGGEGNDRLVGGAGNNILIGGNGADTIFGGSLAD